MSIFGNVSCGFTIMGAFLFWNVTAFKSKKRFYTKTAENFSAVFV
jgi:hypothetical protein